MAKIIDNKITRSLTLLLSFDFHVQQNLLYGNFDTVTLTLNVDLIWIEH